MNERSAALNTLRARSVFFCDSVSRRGALSSHAYIASTGDCPTDNGDNDDERGNNSDTSRHVSPLR